LWDDDLSRDGNERGKEVVGVLVGVRWDDGCEVLPVPLPFYNSMDRME